MTEPTPAMIEAAARGIFLTNPHSEKSMVDACWDLYAPEAKAALTAAAPLMEAATLREQGDLFTLASRLTGNSPADLHAAQYCYDRANDTERK